MSKASTSKVLPVILCYPITRQKACVFADQREKGKGGDAEKEDEDVL